MATDYSMNLNAKLDTTDVQQKMQQLGQTGATTTSQLEQSVKKLESAVNDLTTSWKNAAKEAQQSGIQMQKLLRGGGAMLVGGIINRIGNIASATGNNGLASTASVAGGALQGAGAGLAFGPIGAAAGSVIGALGSLTDAALTAAKALKDSFESSRDYIQNQARTADVQGRIAQLSQMSPDELNARKQILQRTIRDFEEGRVRIADETRGWTQSTNRGPEEEQQFIIEQARKLRDLEKAAQDAQAELDAMTKMEEEAAKKAKDAAKEAEEKAKAEEAEEKAMRDALNAAEAKAKAEEEAEQKAMAEAAAKAQAEFLRTSGQAGSALGSFQKDRRLESFEKSLENMTPAELMNLRDSLAGQKAAAAAQVESLFGAAQQSGLTSDLEAAQKALESFNEIARMFDMTEMGLGGLTTPSIQQQMQALGSEAMKGYDTAGYGSLERDMYNVEKETQNNTKEAASSLSAIKSNINEIKNMMTQNSNKSVWG